MISVSDLEHMSRSESGEFSSQMDLFSPGAFILSRAAITVRWP